MSLFKDSLLKKSFFAIITYNLPTKLISLGVAILLWVIVLGSRNLEVAKEIPLELLTSPHVMPANEIPEKITFRLSGPRAFLRSVLDRSEEPIRVNLIGSKPGSIHYRLFSDQIRVPIGVKVQLVNPASILIELENIKRKEVPVFLELKGSLSEGYRMSRSQINPEIVQIKGPESRINEVKQLNSLPIELSYLTSSVEKELSFDLKKFNIQIDGPLPRALIEIEPISANFKIKNVDIRVLSDYQARLLEKNVTVFVRAAQRDLTTLNRSHVFGIVDLSKKPPGKYREPVKITLPKHVGLVKVVPDTVQVILE